MGSQPRGISASRGAAVLGLSEFQTPFEVFQRIMEEREPGWNEAHGYALPPEPDSAAMRWGNAFESAVIELAERAVGKNILNREYFVSINGYGNEPFFERRHGYDLANYITCHIDGNYNSRTLEGSTLHEGKTTSAFTFREKWGEPGTDRIPQSYQVQVQHQMLCTGAKEAVVSVLVFPETPDKFEALGWLTRYNPKLGSYFLSLSKTSKTMDSVETLLTTNSTTPIHWAYVLADMGYFHQYPVQANTEAQKRMVEIYREFWHNHILTGTPPEPRTYDDIKRLCPEPKTTIIVPDIIERKIAEYKGITEETANAKKRKERLKTIITKYAATHTGIEDDESAEAVIFRNATGDKLGSWSKTKTGTLVFRA